MTDNESCLCGSGRAYGICCKPFRTMTAEDYRKERANNNHIKAYYIAVAMLSDYLQKVKAHTNRALQEMPEIGQYLLKIDINALNELTDRIFESIPAGNSDNWGERFDSIKTLVDAREWKAACAYYQLLFYKLHNDEGLYSDRIKDLAKNVRIDIHTDQRMLELLRSVFFLTGELTNEIHLDDVLIEKSKHPLEKLKYKFDKAIQFSLVSDNSGAKKIADEVIADLEAVDLEAEKDLYAQDTAAQIYEMYYNFDPDRKWLDKSIEIRNKMDIKKFNNAGKAKYYSDQAYTYWRLEAYETAEQLFHESQGYEETVFAQIYLMDCLAEQKKIKSLKNYLGKVEFKRINEDSIDFLMVLGNAAIRLNDVESMEIIKKYLKDIRVNVPYFQLCLKDLELALEKKGGPVKRILNKLSPIRKYLILQPQINGIGFNLEKLMDDILEEKVKE